MNGSGCLEVRFKFLNFDSVKNRSLLSKSFEKNVLLANFFNFINNYDFF